MAYANACGKRWFKLRGSAERRAAFHCLSRRADNHVLEVGIFVDRVQRSIAAEARLLETTERKFDHRPGTAVDIDVAGHQPVGDLEHVLQIVRPDRRAEPGFRAVGDCDRLVHGIEGMHAQDRPEDLFLRKRGAPSQRCAAPCPFAKQAHARAFD